MKHISGKNSKSALTNVQPQDVQPNATDLRLGKVLRVNERVFEITDDTKKHRGSVTVQPDANGFYTLEIGVYEIVMENEISVADGEAGWVITRSTLVRNGCFLSSGLYDSGYEGGMVACLHVNCGPMRIKQGTRIGQYVCVDAEALHCYDGDYGKGKPHDTKYE